MVLKAEYPILRNLGSDLFNAEFEYAKHREKIILRQFLEVRPLKDEFDKAEAKWVEAVKNI